MMDDSRGRRTLVAPRARQPTRSGTRMEFVDISTPTQRAPDRDTPLVDGLT